MSETTHSGPSYRWTFKVTAANGDQCYAIVRGKSLSSALYHVESLLGLDGKGPDAECAGAFSEHAIVATEAVEEL